MQVLEDLGILKNIKRFAGTSAGAYMAMQLAIGMPVDMIFKENGIPSLQEAFYGELRHCIHRLFPCGLVAL